MSSEETHPNLVPLDDDVEERGFDVVLRGYDRTQVDRQIAYLESLVADAQHSAAEAAAAHQAARTDADRFRRSAAEAQSELERGRPSSEAIGGRIGQMLKLAEEEAAAIRAAAAQEAATLQGRLDEHEAAAAKERAAGTAAARQQAGEALRAAQAQAEQVVADAKRHAAALTTATQQQVADMARQRDAIRTELQRLRDRLAAAMGAAEEA